MLVCVQNLKLTLPQLYLPDNTHQSKHGHKYG